MKYFVCALEAVNLAIPAEWTERIIPADRAQTAVHEVGDHEDFISLPALLRQKDLAAPHGIVLKSGIGGEPSAPEAGGARTVLLAPRIDMEMEIPEEQIQRLPEAFGSLLRFFRGAYFNEASAGQNLILILSPEKLIENIR